MGDKKLLLDVQKGVKVRYARATYGKGNLG